MTPLRLGEYIVVASLAILPTVIAVLGVLGLTKSSLYLYPVMLLALWGMFVILRIMNEAITETKKEKDDAKKLENISKG